MISGGESKYIRTQDARPTSTTWTSTLPRLQFVAHAHLLTLYVAALSPSFSTDVSSSPPGSPSNNVTTMPAKKRCQHAGAPCPNAAIRIVGTCSHCSHHFCASVSLQPLLIWIALAYIYLWVNSTDYLSSMHAPGSLSASVRRLRRTGPSSSPRVPSRARWRSYHEAASVAYQSISPNLAVYILFHLTLSHTAATPSPLSMTPQPRCNRPNATIILLPATFISSRLFTLIWTILLAISIPSRTSIPSRVMQCHSHSVLPTLAPSSPLIYLLRCITVHSSSHSRTAPSCLVSHRSLL